MVQTRIDGAHRNAQLRSDLIAWQSVNLEHHKHSAVLKVQPIEPGLHALPKLVGRGPRFRGLALVGHRWWLLAGELLLPSVCAASVGGRHFQTDPKQPRRELRRAIICVQAAVHDDKNILARVLKIRSPDAHAL